MNAKTHCLTTGMALLLIGLSLAIAVTLTAPQPARANPGVLYAAPDGATSGTCNSWANACTLQYALSRAVSGDEIWVKMGVHYPGGAGNRTATFTLKNGVALYGGFAGTETSRDERDWQANPTILSGDIDQNDINDDGNYIAETWNDIEGENAYHVLTAIYAETGNFTLDGFVITAGLGDSIAKGYGAGLHASNSNSTLQNIIFCGNEAWNDGGGLYAYLSTILLTNVTFSGNKASLFGNGGGMMITSGSTATLTTVTFENNVATDYTGSGLSVGELTTGSSSVVLTDVTFIDNGSSLTDYGGGMFVCYNCTAELTNVAFTRNTAEDGGGLYSDGRSTLTNVTFNNNTATDAGGGMFNWADDTLVTNVTFTNNNAERGGGFYNANTTPTLVDIIFSSNTAKYGGGLYALGEPVIVNAIFNKNTGNTAGGGIYLYSSSFTMGARLINVTISGNSSGEGGGIFINTRV